MTRRDDPDEKTTSDERTSTVTEAAPTARSDTFRPHLVYSRSEHRQKLSEATDRELLLALREGDESALDEIIQRKTGPLEQVVYRILGDAEEARDIVQVTFFRLWEKRDRFDDRWSPNTWIYRIATNLAIDQLRSRQSRRRHDEPYRLHLRDAARAQTTRDTANLTESEVMAIFHELAADLTEKQRAIFLLREVEGLPSKEVAEITGCRESTVRNHLFNARKILRRTLVERYPEYARAYRQRKGKSS